MGIEIINTVELAKREKKRTVVINTRKFHAWVHYYPNPGDHDEMHCHNADQTFICIEGQCTMSFPDGGASTLGPGMAALIEGGSFYQLENTGDGPMVLMGTRTGPNSANTHINYDTKKDVLNIRDTRAVGEKTDRRDSQNLK